MNKNGTRWALLTFANGVTCAVLGHYVTSGAALLMSFVFAMFGGLAISYGDE
jgi:hypothetical protein